MRLLAISPSPPTGAVASVLTVTCTATGTEADALRAAIQQDGLHVHIRNTSGTDRLYLIDTHGDVRATWSGLGLELVVVGRDGELYSAGAEGVVRRYALP